MALFIWLDINRYKAFLPLYTAGKCISLFLMLGWLIIARQVTMMGSIFGKSFYNEMTLFGGDLFTLIAVLLIMKYGKNADKELIEPEPAAIKDGGEINACNSDSER